MSVQCQFLCFFPLKSSNDRIQLFKIPIFSQFLKCIPKQNTLLPKPNKSLASSAFLFILTKSHFQSLHFQAISILVPKFYFYSFQSLFWKTPPFQSLLLHQKRRKLTWQTAGINNIKLMFTWPKLIIKNIFWH